MINEYLEALKSKVRSPFKAQKVDSNTVLLFMNNELIDEFHPNMQSIPMMLWKYEIYKRVYDVGYDDGFEDFRKKAIEEIKRKTSRYF